MSVPSLKTVCSFLCCDRCVDIYTFLLKEERTFDIPNNKQTQRRKVEYKEDCSIRTVNLGFTDVPGPSYPSMVDFSVEVN